MRVWHMEDCLETRRVVIRKEGGMQNSEPHGPLAEKGVAEGTVLTWESHLRHLVQFESHLR